MNTPNSSHNSPSKYVILLVSSLFVMYAVVGGMIGLIDARAQAAPQSKNGALPQLEYLSDVLARVRNDYVDEPSMSKVLDGGIRGLLETVDPAGGYLAPADAAFQKEYDPEKTQGIGVFLAKRSGYPMVVSSVPGSAAAKASLVTGDIIESIDGMTTREMNIVEIRKHLAVPAGKPVNLAVIRRTRTSTDPEKVTVNREAFRVPAVESKMIESNVAYVRVPYLGTGKASDARKQLEGLLKKGATGVILDLRNTAGSSEQEAAELANLFLDKGVTIASRQGQKSAKTPILAGPGAAVTKAPLAVLINLGTMGTAELVAAGIADANRGQLVGVRTWGYASVEHLLPLPEGAAVLLATERYSTPNGKEIQDAGVRPTVDALSGTELGVDISPDEIDDLPQGKPAGGKGAAPPKNTDDPQLKKAIEVLRNPPAAKGE